MAVSCSRTVLFAAGGGEFFNHRQTQYDRGGGQAAHIRELARAATCIIVIDAIIVAIFMMGRRISVRNGHTELVKIMLSVRVCVCYVTVCAICMAEID